MVGAPEVVERPVGVVDLGVGEVEGARLVAKGAHHRRTRDHLRKEGEQRRFGHRLETLQLACSDAVLPEDSVRDHPSRGDGGEDDELGGELTRSEEAHEGNGQTVEERPNRVFELVGHLLIDGRNVRREAVEDPADGCRLKPRDACTQHRVHHAAMQPSRGAH